MYKALSNVSHALVSKPIVPIHKCFLFEGAWGKTFVTASDGDSTLTLRVPVREEWSGKFCINAARTLEILKQLEDEDVELEIQKLEEDYSKIVGKYNNGSFEMSGENANDYPLVEHGEWPTTIHIYNAPKLIEAVSTVFPFVANEELHKVLSGVFFDFTEENIDIVGTNSKVLGRVVLEEATSTPVKMILPRRASDILRKVFAHEEDILITTDGKLVRFESETASLEARLIDGNYPNYKRIFAEPKHTAEIEREPFIYGLKRISAFAEVECKAVKLNFQNEKVKIVCESVFESNSGTETVPCLYNEEETSLCLRYDHLLEVLKQIRSDEVSVGILGRFTPVLLAPVAYQKMHVAFLLTQVASQQ